MDFLPQSTHFVKDRDDSRKLQKGGEQEFCYMLQGDQKRSEQVGVMVGMFVITLGSRSKSCAAMKFTHQRGAFLIIPLPLESGIADPKL